MTDVTILGFLVLWVLVIAPHVLSLARSRSGSSKIHHRLFISGIVGLLGPSLLIFALVAMLAGFAGGGSWLLDVLLFGSAAAILLAWIASLGLLVALRRSTSHSHV